jgi:hypothetical protein
MNTFFTFLGRAMGDGENPSSARLLAVAVVPAAILVPLAAWAALSLHAHALLEMPGSVTGFVSAANAPLLALLHFNKRIEAFDGASRQRPGVGSQRSGDGAGGSPALQGNGATGGGRAPS